VTYRWKSLDNYYNFALNLIFIGGLHTKLWAPKVVGVPILGISGLPFRSLATKWHLGVGLVARHRVYHKGEGGGFPQVWAVASLMNPCLPVVRPCTKVLQLRTNQLVVWLVQVRVSNWITCQSSQSHLEAPACPSTPEVLRTKECAPIPSPYVVFTFGLAIESIKSLEVRHLISPMVGLRFPPRKWAKCNLHNPNREILENPN